MPGPQTQHKGTVYGDDENAPKPGLLTYYLILLGGGVKCVSAGIDPSPARRAPETRASNYRVVSAGIALPIREARTLDCTLVL